MFAPSQTLPAHQQQQQQQQQQHQQQQPVPRPDPQNVLICIRRCMSSDTAERGPAEHALELWEDEPAAGGTGYLTSLLSLLESASLGGAGTAGGNDDGGTRVLAAILLKNAIPKAFGVPLDGDAENTAATEGGEVDAAATAASREAMRNERAAVRSRLPAILFGFAPPPSDAPVPTASDAVAVHLQLALGNVALFDFPKAWPTLLEDLAGVADGSSPLNESARRRWPQHSQQQQPTTAYSPDETMRVRAIYALRLCLRSIRHFKLMVQKPRGGGGGRPAGGMAGIIAMGGLGKLINRAVSDRRDMHRRACGCFNSLAAGILRHSEAAVAMAAATSTGGGRSWRADAKLAVGFVKCLSELLPMIEIEDARTDSRFPLVRDALGNAARIADATKEYPMTINGSGGDSDDERESYAAATDKLHRATLALLASSIRMQPRAFAPHLMIALSCAVGPILTRNADSLRSLPDKRSVRASAFVRAALKCPEYDSDAARRVVSGGGKNAVLAALMGRTTGTRDGSGNGGEGEGGDRGDDADPGLIAARSTMDALLAPGTVEPLVESIVGKLILLRPDELEEWEDDPEGRYETDLAERADAAMREIPETPRRCGAALLGALADREPDRTAAALLDLTRRAREIPESATDKYGGMLAREACYRALETCRSVMVGIGGEGGGAIGGATANGNDGGRRRRLDFAEWWASELGPMLRADLGDGAPVPTRAMQARAVQVLQAYAPSLPECDFGNAFACVSRLVAASDLVTALCAASCLNRLALMHVRGTDESSQLVRVREHSAAALGNAFALARRASSEECLRVTLRCVSGLVEANGTYLEPVLKAIAEQLPPLWDRAGDSVPIHSCLVSVLNHLVMKMGAGTVENADVQRVLFPLLDYCTDVSQTNRAETLLEDGLKLWLVTLVSSRLATMGQSLRSMLPRLETILRTGLEPHLSLKVLQFNAVLLGPEAVEPLADCLRNLLLGLTSCLHSPGGGGGGGGAGNAMEGGTGGEGGGARWAPGISIDRDTARDCAAALGFADALLQLFPDLGCRVGAPAIYRAVSSIPGGAVPPALSEATFSALGRLAWIRPGSLEEIFPAGGGGDCSGRSGDDGIRATVASWIRFAGRMTMMTLLSPGARTAAFVEQKGAALSLCASVCHSPRVARLVGADVLQFTRAVENVETRSDLDVGSLIEVVCGTARGVVGDGPLGDSAARTAELVKADPLLTVGLRDALESAEKAVASVGSVQ